MTGDSWLSRINLLISSAREEKWMECEFVRMVVVFELKYLSERWKLNGC